MQKLFKSLIVTLIIWLTCNTAIHSQSVIKNELIVQFSDSCNEKMIRQELIEKRMKEGTFEIKNVSSKPLNVKRLIFKSEGKNMKELIDFLSKQNYVKNVQYNHRITSRALPNDPKFSKQWHLQNTGQSGGLAGSDISAPNAWDITTGGNTPSGDTIVIAIVDDGLDINHEDIKQNLWTNYGEKQNGIDDDGNGVIDDIHGYNAESNSGNIPKGSHGTSVAGLIGADGNNGIGTTGVSWKVKLMPVFNGSTEADIISAYAYVIMMRKTYDQSNGLKGAYVVATNSSFGTDYAKSEDHPIWCSMYDSLGQAGILSFVATANLSIDVDNLGDMPSTCPSNYLIAVTNIDKYDQVAYAGTGHKSIDVGSYGEQTYTISPNNSYTSFSGTSAATPVATGLAGLMYSYSSELNNVAKTNKEVSVLMAKDAVLEGTRKINSLKSITQSEGVINAYNTLKTLDKYSNDCKTPWDITLDSLLMNKAVLNCEGNSGGKFNIMINNGAGNILKSENNTIVIPNLNSCSEYQIKIRRICNDTVSQWSYPIEFKTDGCCTSPIIKDYSISNDSILINWNQITAAKSYVLNYKSWAQPVWKEKIVNDNHANLEFPQDCGTVLVKISSLCTDSLSEKYSYAEIGNNCTECNELEYCYPELDNSYEWIEGIKIGNFSYQNGNNENVAGIFNKSGSIELIKGNTYSMNVQLGFSETVYNDYVYLYIDLNHDGTFSKDEVITNTSNTETSAVLNFNTPFSSYSGPTTMRIVLCSSQLTDPCELNYDNDYGEYEDYCVYISDTNPCNISDFELQVTAIDSTSIAFKAKNFTNQNDNYLTLDVKEDNFLNPSVYIQSNPELLISGLDKCTEYSAYISHYCNDYQYQNTNIIDAKTLCPNITYESMINNYILSPNPFFEDVFILNDDKSDYVIKVFDALGKMIFKQMMNANENKISLSSSIKMSGIYFFNIESGGRNKTYKMVKF